MTEEKLADIVASEFKTAQGAESGEIGKERAKAWRYYNREHFGDEEEGQSQVVTSDVADVVDGLMPSLLRIFTTAENLVDFDPVGSDNEEETAKDIAQAEQASDYVNYVFFKQNPAFMILYTWFMDGLISKNGIVKAWWDESEVVTTETYEGLSDFDFVKFQSDDELEIEDHARRKDVTVAADGVSEIEATLHDVTYKRSRKANQVRIEPVPPEEYRISADAKSLDPSEARMSGHERELTRSDLLDMGFDKKLVDSLPAEDNTAKTTEKIARENKVDDDDRAAHDRSQDRILVREAYIRVDFDGDGRSELRQVITANGKVLTNEEADRSPFHVISPHPQPHKHFGKSSADKVMDIQEVNSTVFRQTLNNLYHTNNPSHAVWEQGIGENTIDDLLTTRVGGIKRFSRPPSESYTPLTVPFTARESFPMFEFLEKMKRDRTGIASDSEGLSPDALKNIQQSVLMQAADLSRMKIEAVVRIFAETGVKSLFLHIHELLQKHQKKRDVVLLRDKWIPVNPQEWRTRKNMTVKIGLGIGTREQNLLHLNMIREVQREIVDGGGLGTLVSLKNLFNTGAEIVKNANLKNPAMFFTDPGETQPQQNDGQSELAAAQLKLAQDQIQLQAREQALDQDRNHLQHQREVAKIEQSQQKMQNDFTIALEQIATKLTEIEAKHAVDVPGSKI